MAALISSVMNTKDRCPFYVNACDEIGIEVLPPDVNESQVDFAVVEGKIRFGLNAVKNVGEAACRGDRRARARRAARSTSIWDFTERVDPQVVNKRALESLVKCGALDSTGASRKGMLDVLEQALSWGGSEHGRPARRPGLDLRPRRRGGRAAPRAPSADRRRTSSRRASCCAREGDARPLRLRAPAARASRDQLRRKTDCAARRARAPPRRRDRHGRRDRLGGEAADDEEGRPDGVPPPRRPHRQRRGRRLQLGLRAARASCSRPTGPRRQGPRRPQERARRS